MKYLFFLPAFLLLLNNSQMGHCLSDTTKIEMTLIDSLDSCDVATDSLIVIDSLNISSFVIKKEKIPDSVYIKNLTSLCFNFKMTYNPIVKSYIELYGKRSKNKTAIMIGLSVYYFPIIEEILKNYGLPPELKYISIIESALNPRAVSPARAKGLWQFIKSTGMENGLTINKFVDQRFGVIESTTAAARHLRSLYTTYGDWQLVFAAYNCGSGNVNKAIRRSGGKRDFWEIYRYLPRETRAYVPAFIGAAYVFNYYKDLNITPAPAISLVQCDTIIISKNLHLKQIANVLDIPIEVIRKLNPQYITDFVPANGKVNYFLNIPKEQKIRFIELKDSIYAHRSAYYTKEILNRNIRYTSYNSESSTKIIHSVRTGESLWLIAEKYNVSVTSIKTWNRITGSKIKQGQKLVLYLDRRWKNL